jgi:hypothetical protein
MYHGLYSEMVGIEVDQYDFHPTADPVVDDFRRSRANLVGVGEIVRREPTSGIPGRRLSAPDPKGPGRVFPSTRARVRLRMLAKLVGQPRQRWLPTLCRLRAITRAGSSPHDRLRAGPSPSRPHQVACIDIGGPTRLAERGIVHVRRQILPRLTTTVKRLWASRST